MVGSPNIFAQKLAQLTIFFQVNLGISTLTPIVGTVPHLKQLKLKAITPIHMIYSIVHTIIVRFSSRARFRMASYLSMNNYTNQVFFFAYLNQGQEPFAISMVHG